MPKMKTKSAAKKRFSITGTGKIKRTVAGKRHLLINKTKKSKRKARTGHMLDSANFKATVHFLGQK